MGVALSDYLVVSALLFGVGVYGLVTKRNAMRLVFAVEILVNAANVNFIAFNHYVAQPGTLAGQVFSIFVIVLAAAEAAIGLAIVLAIYQTFKTIDVQETDLLKE